MNFQPFSTFRAASRPGRFPSLAAPRGRVAGLRSRRTGFTLIELMITIALAAIAISLAGPAMTKMVRSNRVQTEASSFVSDLQFARTEAVKRGQPVSVCQSSDSATCTNANTWEMGWIVFSNPSAAGATCTVPTSGTSIVRVRAALKGGDTFVAAPASTCVTFNREGFTNNLGTATMYFKLHTSDNVALATRCVVVDLGGRVTVQTSGQTSSCN